MKQIVITAFILAAMFVAGTGGSEGKAAAKSDKRSGGSFSRTFTFTVTDYSIVTEDGFDVVKIPDAELSYNPLKPLLPFFITTLNLPKEASVTSVRLAHGNTESLGKLNIPNFQDSSMSYPLPKFTDITDVQGLYPQPNFGFSYGVNDSYSDAVIYFFPVQHNVDNDETTLWTEAAVEIQYEVGECVFISAFSSGKSDYVTTEKISGRAVLENAGDQDVSGLTAVFDIKDPYNIIRSSEQIIESVPAGEKTELRVTADNGLSTGSYRSVLQIRDGTGSVISSASEWIWVFSDGISDICIPGETVLDRGDDISFTVTFKNSNLSDMEGLMAVEIYKGHTLKDMFAAAAFIPASSEKEITVSGSTRRLEPGRYDAIAVFMQPMKDERTSDFISFTIRSAADFDCDLGVSLGDAVIALGFAASGELPSEFCSGDADGDGKVGVGDAVFILRELAEMW